MLSTSEGRLTVRNLVWVLIVLSAVGFILAVVGVFMGRPLLRVGPEGMSRTCTNLALLAIALMMATNKK